jgi:CRISPR-associated protein Cas6
MIVDVGFRVNGERLPADHGYLLYGGLTTALPALHGDGVRYGVHPVRGQPLPGRELALQQDSRLVIRIDHEQIPLVLPLAGKTLRVGRYSVALGVPDVRPLQASDALYSRLVIIKGFTEPETFREAAQRQVEQAGVSGTVELVQPRHAFRFELRSGAGAGPVRRTLHVRDKEIVGFAVRVTGLTDEAAIRLQEQGLGGRQHFGCGVLVPAPRQAAQRPARSAEVVRSLVEQV